MFVKFLGKRALNLIIKHCALGDFVKAIFVECGVNGVDARSIADVLVKADLRGVHSHGVMRVDEYVSNLKGGGWSAKRSMSVEREGSINVLLNGNDGIGIITALRAMEMAIELAKKRGVGIVNVRGAGHFGTAAYYSMMAQKTDMIGVVLTNGSPAMAPTGGLECIIGNNPWSVAVPGEDEPGIVLDMANSIVARGKVRLADKKNQPIPLDWALDENGKPTSDPMEALKGTILPIGGYKGYGISLIVDVLAGILSGAAYGKHVGSPRDSHNRQNVGQMFIALDIDEFQPVSDFKSNVTNYIREIKESKKAEYCQEIFVPGEIEYLNERRQLENGIELSGDIFKGLLKVADGLRVPTPKKLN